MYLFPRELAAHALYILLNIRSSQPSRCNRNLLRAHLASLSRMQLLQRLGYLLLHQANHADPIFQLDIAIIAIRFRKRAPGAHVKLIAGVNEVNTVFRIDLLLPFLYQINGIAQLLRCKRLKRIQTIAVLRETDRHDRNTLHRRNVFRQITDRTV